MTGSRTDRLGGVGADIRFPDLTGLLQARSVAVVGASDRDGNIGGIAVRHLVRFGFAGDVWPVHPTAATVAGLPAYPDIAALPGRPDLAIIGLPAAKAVDMAEQCGRAGIGNAVIWAGGFSETGPAGRRLQERLARVCADTGVNLCGPNCLGLINTSTRLTATYSSGLFETEELLPGTISMVSQSGGITAAALALAARAGHGFRHVVSVGNEAVISAADFIHHFAADPAVRVITGYLEGVKDGAKLVAALRAAHAAGKPVVLLKGGRSAESARAAMSHTAVLAGEDRVFTAVLARYHVITVHSVEELLDTAFLLNSVRADQLGAGRNVAITSTGGGGAVLATDQCIRHGLSVPPLSQPVVEQARSRLTPLAAVGNPTDLTPESLNQESWRRQLPDALATIAADPGVDMILFLAAAMRHRADQIVKVIAGLRESTDKPVCVSWPLAPTEALAALASQGVHAFPEHDRAARALGHLAGYLPPAAGPGQPPAPERVPTDPHIAAEVTRVLDALDLPGTSDLPGPVIVPEHRCRPLLAAAGLDMAPGSVATTVADAIAAAGEVGYPVVVKAATDQVTHRYAAGLVRLGVTSDTELTAAARGIFQRAETAGIQVEGLLVQNMVAGEWEFLVSAFTDEQFGLMVSVAVGGVFTELWDDVVLAPGPLTPDAAERMVRGLRLFQARPQALDQVSPAALASFVSRFSVLAGLLPWPRFTFEINPCKCGPDGAVAVDSLLIVGGAVPEARDHA